MARPRFRPRFRPDSDHPDPEPRPGGRLEKEAYIRQKDHFEHLFTAARIAGLALKNRVVALPLYTGYAHPDGRVSPLMLSHYQRIARSGVALVVVGNAAVSADGATARCNLRVHGDEFVHGLRRLSGVIKRAGALSCLQLNHGGPFAKNGTPLVPSSMDGATFTHDIASLRAFMETFPVSERFGLTRQLMEMAYYWQRPMTGRERYRVAGDFADAAHRAWQAGFDMVELHGGTGYLLASYLSGYTNKIPEGLGGSLAERAAYPLQVIDAVKQRLPTKFPVGFRLLFHEWVPGGIDTNEATAFAKMLEAHETAYLSVTAGTYHSMFKPEVIRTTAKPGHLAEGTAALKDAVTCPVIISGRVFTPKVAERVLRDNQADLIGLARPLLVDHQWLEKAASGEKITVCKNCNECLKRVVLDKGVICACWDEGKKIHIDLETDILSRKLFNALVVAADPADLERMRHGWQLRMPPAEDLYVRFLLLRQDNTEEMTDYDIQAFLSWARGALQKRGVLAGQIDSEIRYAQKPLDEEVYEEIKKGDFGTIVLGANPHESWRQRLAAKHQTDAISFVGMHPEPTRVIVPVDLTRVSAILLRVIDHVFSGKPAFDFTFVHIYEKNPGAATGRWREILDIQGWDQDTPLQLIPAENGVSNALCHEIETGGYGSVIMGRRRITAVRRWLLGSVSREVINRLADQHITLVG